MVDEESVQHSNKTILEKTNYLPYPDGSSTLYLDECDQEEIRKKLEWYFKTPYDKFKDSGRKPFKFLLQIIKIICVTIQATYFVENEFSLVHCNHDNLETFNNLFIMEYNGNVLKTLYTKASVYRHIFYAWKQYYNFEGNTLGSYVVVKNNNTIQPVFFLYGMEYKSRRNSDEWWKFIC